MAFLDSLLFPQENACHLCGRFQSAQGVVCSACIRELEALHIHHGVSRMLPALQGSMAAFHHEGIARRMVHQLKYRSDPAIASFMGLYMADALDGLRMDLILPVPLHPEKLEERGFNQAAALAQAVSAHTAIPCDPSTLLRMHSTGTQVYQSREKRLAAMQGAFAVADSSCIRGKNILLVDDVVTTGATAIACTQVLQKAGAKEVWLLTFSRA